MLNSTKTYKHFLRVMDYIFFMRPVILIPLWSFILIGYFLSRYTIRPDMFFQWYIPFLLIIKTFLATLIMGIIYIVNQIFDCETDALNKKLFFIPSGIVTLKQAKIQVYILFIIFVFGVFIFRLDLYFTLFNILLLILGLCYSIPPLQFKGRPGLDILVNTIGYGWLSFFIGWTVINNPSLPMLNHSMPYFIFMAAVYINTTLIDLEGDRESALSTTGVFLGSIKSSVISLIFVVLTLILGFIQKDWIIFTIVGLSSPLFILAVIRNVRKYFLISVQIPGWLFVIFLGLIFPYYFILIVCLYLITKFYYKQRFNMDYPRLGEEKNAN